MNHTPCSGSKRHTIRILIHRADINNRPDIRNKAQKAKREHSNQQLSHRTPGMTGIEIVNTETTEQHTEEYVGNTRFCNNRSLSPTLLERIRSLFRHML